MLYLSRIEKPGTIQEALRLLQEPGAVALAGGTQLVASRRRDVLCAVDLAGLGLDYIATQDGEVSIGAMTLLRSLVESDVLRGSANGIVSQAAHRTTASILRNQVTLAGTVFTDPSGVLAVALLALDANAVLVSQDGEIKIGLEELWAGAEKFGGSILREVRIARSNSRAGLEAIGRTPRDKAIVSVCVADRVDSGKVGDFAISLGGVAPAAVRARAAENLLAEKALTPERIGSAAEAAADGLTPPSDYRGSAEYRREMVRVLVGRLLSTF